MGVPGLWKELQGYGGEGALARLCELGRPGSPSRSPSPSSPPPLLRLGIDVSSWMYHAQKSVGGHNPILRTFFWRLCRLLSVPYLLPVFVFDGPLRPQEKRGRVAGSYREAAFVDDLKDLIAAFGFVTLDAMGEAEAEMASLNRDGLLDAVMSDDVDCFVFGAKLVVRNWGQELSGTKARAEFVSEPGRDQQSGKERPCLSAKDRLALGKNLITHYDAADLHDDGLTHSGLILVALLSGGDYDVQGLPRCGVKISTALARAGYGDSLLEGLHKHCTPPQQSGQTTSLARSPAPQPSEAWDGFLRQWLASVRHELCTNESNRLGRKFSKLAQSVQFTELLSTKASLCVLASYVWPLTTPRSTPFAPRSLDVGAIAALCQKLFRWTAPLVLETFRNKLWEGCAMREMSGIGSLSRLTCSSRRGSPGLQGSKSKTDRYGKAGNGKGKISSFFAEKASDTLPAPAVASVTADPLSPPTGSLVVSVEGERQSGSTGYVAEFRLVCDVRAYVEMAKSSLDFSLFVEEVVEQDGAPSLQSTSVSPSKRKPFVQPDEHLRMWMAKDIVERDGSTADALLYYLNRQGAKKKAGGKTTGGGTCGRPIDSFFTGTKTGAPRPAIQTGPKLSPSKRRGAPLREGSRVSLPQTSTPSPSPPPSPLATATATRRRGKGQKKTSENGGNEEREPSWKADWNPSILDDPPDEQQSTGDGSIGDYSLPSLCAPSRAVDGGLKAVMDASADDSVEFVKATTSPIKKRLSQAIEVIDDSDED